MSENDINELIVMIISKLKNETGNSSLDDKLSKFIEVSTEGERILSVAGITVIVIFALIFIILFFSF